MNSFTFTSIETSELLQSLSLDSQTKALEIPEPTKKVTWCSLVITAAFC